MKKIAMFFLILLNFSCEQYVQENEIIALNSLVSPVVMIGYAKDSSTVIVRDCENRFVTLTKTNAKLLINSYKKNEVIR